MFGSQPPIAACLTTTCCGCTADEADAPVACPTEVQGWLGSSGRTEVATPCSGLRRESQLHWRCGLSDRAARMIGIVRSAEVAPACSGLWNRSQLHRCRRRRHPHQRAAWMVWIIGSVQIASGCQTGHVRGVPQESQPVLSLWSATLRSRRIAGRKRQSGAPHPFGKRANARSARGESADESCRRLRRRSL